MNTTTRKPPRQPRRVFNNPKVLEGISTFETWAKFINRVLMLLVILSALMIIGQDYFDNTYLIKAFTVPKQLDDKGYSGTAFVSSIFVELTKARKNLVYQSNQGNLRSLSASHIATSRKGLNLEEEANVREGTKLGDFDLKSATHFIKRLFGIPEKNISGVVTIEKKNTNEEVYSLNMKILPDGKIIPIEHNTIEGLVKAAAYELILFNLKAYESDHLIIYYSSLKCFEQAETIAIRTKDSLGKWEKTTDADWIGLYLAWSNLDIAQENLQKAMEKVELLKGKCHRDISWRCQEILINTTQMLNAYYNIDSAKNQMGVVDTTIKNNKVNGYADRTIQLCQFIETNQSQLDTVYASKKSTMALVHFFWSQALSVSSKTSDDRINVKMYLDKALKLDPNLALAHNDLAYYYMIDADPLDFRKAEEHIKEALQIHPYHGVFLDTYAEFFLYQKKYEKCFEYLDKALSNQNAFEFITAKLYDKDTRWDEFRVKGSKYKDRFKVLLDKYRDENTTIK